MKHSIPPNVLNSDIDYCIDEYVRLIAHREILRESWFYGLSFERIAEKHNVSVQTVKNVIYDIGDTILHRAANMRSPTD